MHTRRITLLVACFAVAALAMGLAGCPKDKAEDGDADGGVVNSKCPIMPARDVSPDTNLTREFKGKTVGFCCAGCPAEWDALSDEEKAAKLAAVCGCDADAAQCSGEEGCDCVKCTAEAAVQCTGEDDCQCAHCTADQVVQCTGEEGCRCAHCAVEEVVQCTGEEDCPCAHCTAAEVVQCTGEADCQCAHCAS